MGLVVKGKTPRIRALDLFEDRLVESLARLMRESGRKVDWEAVAAAVTNLDADSIVRLINDLQWASSRWEDLQARLVDVIGRAGEAEARAIASIIDATPAWGGPGTITGTPSIPFRFDRTNPNAMQWAQLRAAQLVTAIDQTTEASVRRIIFESFRDQVSGPETARRLRNIVGLHPRWALAVDKYSAREYERLRKAGLSPEAAREKAQAGTERYRAKLIRARARMIARTEIMTASNMGRQMAWSQGVDGGWVDPVSQKRWSTSNTLAGLKDPARGICDRCAPMRGETVRVDQPFSNGLMMPPAHPNCRCTAALVPPSRGLSGLPSQNLDAIVAELGSTDASVPS